MNKKYNYRWTACEDTTQIDNGYNCEVESIVTDGIYDFEDYLQDHDVEFEYDEAENTYYVLDEDGERTGEAFWIVSIEDTDEEIN